MPEPIVIALDAMGGDHGPEVVIPAAALSLVRHPNTRYLFVGNEARIRPLVEADTALGGRADIHHTELAIEMHEKPGQALMRGRGKSSMWLAIEAVKSGRASVAVSAGNTGALMAMAKVCLKMIPNVDRPAIAAIWPTVLSECLVLDLGANVGATKDQLIEFSLMGSAMARALFNIERPKVGLLNIGIEDMKGLEELKDAHAILKASSLPFEYLGFVEGDKIGHGAADVVVTDGFTGNIALKTAEGTARQMAAYLRDAMNRTLLSKLGGLLATGAFQVLRDKMDPRRLNGGVFLGLDGLVIKSHGGTDEIGFASAIDLGYDLASAKLSARIAEGLAAYRSAKANDIAS